MPLRVADLHHLPQGKHFDTGRHGCPGLYLLVKDGERGRASRGHNQPSPGRRSWVVRVVINGKRCELGIGSLRDLTLNQARDAARAIRQEVRNGDDPRKTRAARKAKRVTFAEIAEETWKERWKSLSNPKHRAQWETTLRGTFDVLGDVPVGEVDSDLILQAVRPLWTDVPETAKRTLQRIGHVLDVARAKRLYHLPSPLAAVRAALPKNGNDVKHFAALPVDAIPDFARRLRALNSPSAWAVELALLTVARTRPVRLMTKDEVAAEGTVWRVPGAHMKGGKAWDYPLTPRALELIKRGRELNGAHVFSSPRDPDKALSDTAMLEALRGIAPGMTVHGLRSSFTDWCRRENEDKSKPAIDFELQELCLAHVLPGKVRRAYARDMLIGPRREVLERWEAYTSA